jgi:hypothetical protein
MQRNWEMDDEEAYEGPDAYVEGDEIEHEVEEQVEALTDGYGSSVQGILRCAYSAIVYLTILKKVFPAQPYLTSRIFRRARVRVPRQDRSE